MIGNLFIVYNVFTAYSFIITAFLKDLKTGENSVLTKNGHRLKYFLRSSLQIQNAPTSSNFVYKMQQTSGRKLNNAIKNDTRIRIFTCSGPKHYFEHIIYYA